MDLYPYIPTRDPSALTLTREDHKGHPQTPYIAHKIYSSTYTLQVPIE